MSLLWAEVTSPRRARGLPGQRKERMAGPARALAAGGGSGVQGGSGGAMELNEMLYNKSEYIETVRPGSGPGWGRERDQGQDRAPGSRGSGPA